jgi:hypothetical protein
LRLAELEAKTCEKFCRNLAPVKRPLFNDRLDHDGYFISGLEAAHAQPLSIMSARLFVSATQCTTLPLFLERRT